MNKVLLDTHLLIWLLTGDVRLSKDIIRIVLNPDNLLFYSIVSLWEAEIKFIKHSDDIPVSSNELERFCNDAGYYKLPLKSCHISRLRDLRRKKEAPPHKDPFDRMLICQSVHERMLLITHDHLFADYLLSNILVL